MRLTNRSAGLEPRVAASGLARTLAIGGTAAMLLAVPVTSSFAAEPSPLSDTSAPPVPAYQAVSTTHLHSGLGSDIAASAFVSADGQFHFTNAATTYSDSPSSGWAHTFTNTNLATVSTGYGTTTSKVTADAFYATPGSVCYQLDKSAVYPIPSPQEDDHCDVIGVWVDPDTGTWHALLNDEYQFDPWHVTGADSTVAKKVSTGLHNDRILLATSDDHGASWQYQGPALTSHWDHNGIVDDVSSPGNTYPFGDSGPRLYVDYSSGYFYITYNVKIYRKPYAHTVASWTEMARAPINGKMAPGTWTKYYDGSWSQPGIGGIDGNVGGLPGMTVTYDPATDTVAFQGTDPAGRHIDVRATSVPSSTHLFTFSNGTQTFTANTLHHWIKDSAGTEVPEVDYTDPITGQSVTVLGKDDIYQDGQKVFEGGIFATWTDPATGRTRTARYNTGSTVWEDPATQVLYDPQIANEESAVSYDAYSERYRLVGYDGNVYETADLGDPTSWRIVGTMPAGSYGGYLTTLDAGSLTNQNVTGSSFLTISDLSGRVTRVTMTPHIPGVQTVYSKGRVPKDIDGQPIDPSTAYTIEIGDAQLSTSGRNSTPVTWKLVPVTNPDYPYGSGFYRLQNAADGTYLQVSGSTPAEQRAMGATVTAGSEQPGPDPDANDGLGTPGGSDEWYIQVVAPKGSTSLAGSTTYRLVNRNSGLALELRDGQFRLTQQAPGDAGQYVSFSTDPEWIPSAAYTDGDSVFYHGSTWHAMWWTRNQEPGDPYGPWEQMVTAPDGTAIWTPSRVFESGDVAQFQGRRYEAQWWTRNQEPGDPYGPWKPVRS